MIKLFRVKLLAGLLIGMFNTSAISENETGIATNTIPDAVIMHNTVARNTHANALLNPEFSISFKSMDEAKKFIRIRRVAQIIILAEISALCIAGLSAIIVMTSPTYDNNFHEAKSACRYVVQQIPLWNATYLPNPNGLSNITFPMTEKLALAQSIFGTFMSVTNYAQNYLQIIALLN